MTMNHKLTRKDIVLSASNQDGGAYVDASPNGKTLELKEGVGVFSTIEQGIATTTKLSDHHLPLIRQFSYEVLSSPDFLSLSEKHQARS